MFRGPAPAGPRPYRHAGAMDRAARAYVAELDRRLADAVAVYVVGSAALGAHEPGEQLVLAAERASRYAEEGVLSPKREALEWALLRSR